MKPHVYDVDWKNWLCPDELLSSIMNVNCVYVCVCRSCSIPSKVESVGQVKTC